MTTTNTPQTFDTIGYYAVVQYCPDRGRAECANVGVILLVPSLAYINGVEDPTNARAKRFFGQDITNWDHFNAAKESIFTRIVKDKAYFRTLSDLERFANTRGNSFILTTPRWCKVNKAPFLVLSELFDELVKEKEVPNETTTDSTSNSAPPIT